MAETVEFLDIKVTITGRVVGDDGAELLVDETYQKRLTNGTGSNNVSYVLQDESRNLSSTSEALNLDGISDFQGSASPARNNVAMMYFRNLDADTGDGFEIGATTANAFVNWVGDATDKIELGPDGIFLLVSPVDKYDITAGTGDLLKVKSDDNSDYRFILAGDNT